MADTSTPMVRRWQVLVLGGPSGAGKTAVSYRLAQHFGVALTEVDDFQVMMERMTTPDQQPALHFWRVHPSFDQLPATEIMEQGLTVGHAMAPGLDAVIANHLETAMPVVLEGDFLHPALAVQAEYGGIPNDGRVRGIFLHEPDEEQLVANFLAREPERGVQSKRARVSWLFGQWLKDEGARCGVPVLPARPWDTVFDRVLAELS